MFLRDQPAACSNHHVRSDAQTGMPIEITKIANQRVVADFNCSSAGLEDGKPANAHTFAEPDFTLLIRQENRPTQDADIRPQEDARPAFELA